MPERISGQDPSGQVGRLGAAILGTTFQHILDAISDGVYVTTAEREIIYWSAGAERITGYLAADVIGKHCYDDVLVHTDLNGRRLCLDGCPLQDCILHGAEHTVNEVFLKREDGERLAVYVKTATFTEAGHTFGVEIFGELETIAGEELTARVQELSDSSITDPLTGLFNRRSFDASLEQSFAMFQRLERRYGVLHLDVDDFKSINDTFGHATGDEAIRFVAGVLSANARAMDVAARYGGDEFTVNCAVSTPAELEGCGRRLVRLIHDSRFAGPIDAGHSLTVSAGGTLVADTDTDARQALGRADDAMYEAKEAGRDRVAMKRSEPGLESARRPFATLEESLGDHERQRKEHLARVADEEPRDARRDRGGQQHRDAACEHPGPVDAAKQQDSRRDDGRDHHEGRDRRSGKPATVGVVEEVALGDRLEAQKRDRPHKPERRHREIEDPLTGDRSAPPEPPDTSALGVFEGRQDPDRREQRMSDETRPRQRDEKRSVAECRSERDHRVVPHEKRDGQRQRERPE
jgi:diguanylate cyclase (GGDEF)-like protein/PAS domain S-box-containing protein